nr:hypothetical protein [Candidatus Sigynarchaeota archaeon]
MSLNLTPLGIACAIGAGSAINIGIVVQKKAVNEIPPDKRDAKFFRNLVSRRTWLLGFIIQIAFGSTLSIAAQAIIGPALLPGLLAVGLIFMAVGAAKIVGESLKRTEIMAIGLIIVAAILLTASDIGVPILDPATFNTMDPIFLANEWEFTAVFFGIIAVTEIIQRKNEKNRAIALACQAGCFLALANYWISPVTVSVVHLVTGTLVMPWELVLGIIGAIVLVLANICNVAVTQKAFKGGNASLVIPIQQVPVNVAPVLVFFWVFSSKARSILTFPFLFIAIGLIIFSSYLLARRQAMLESIALTTTKKEDRLSKGQSE